MSGKFYYKLLFYDGTYFLLYAVALLTERIQAFTEHLRRHRHDTAAKRQLQQLLVRRRKLMQYMIRKDYNNYR